MATTLWDHQVRLSRQIALRAGEGIATREDWLGAREGLHGEFMRSMGLHPLPQRCDLGLTEHGEVRGDGYRAVKLSWQILPDCWATGLLYYPDPLPAGKLPAMLYTCGHGLIGTLHYQQHGILFARRGYACLCFDTIEQHDNPGEHHGTYYGKRYDWLSMGYSGATGEMWNSIRALDVLSGMPEVDAERIGVTGVSGGGAHSLFLAIADSRIRAVATVCGACVPEQTLRDRHLCNHCDCMYYTNLYHRDTSEFAALIAPRPLLLVFGRHDSLFSLDEYQAVFERTRRIYRLCGSEERCDMLIHPVGHGYHPQAHAAIEKWFDRHVAGDERAELQPDPQDVKEEKVISVFAGNPPTPNHLDLLPELLSPRGSFPLPDNAQGWPDARKTAVDALRKEAFHLIDDAKVDFQFAEIRHIISANSTTKRYRGELDGVELWAEAHFPANEPEKIVVGVAGPGEMASDVALRMSEFAVKCAAVAIEPRGCGFTTAPSEMRHHLLRAGVVTGFPPALLMIQDLRHVLDFFLTQPFAKGKPVYLYGRGEAAVACLYHAIFDDRIRGVVLHDIPASHRDGGYLLNILRTADIEQALGLLCPRPLGLCGTVFNLRHWVNRVYQRCGAADKLIQSRHHLGPVFNGVLRGADGLK